MGNKSSAAQIAASIRYNEKNTHRIALAFNKEHDADIIEHIEKQDNKQGYIKRLIRDDMKK